MLKELISLAWFEGGAIGDLLSAWEQAGFFSYLLPFLLIFALVFGILNQIQLFKEKKAINAIIALVVGLMSLQFPMVPLFFSEIFPRLGVGLAIILVVLIFVGMFIDPGKAGIFYILMGIGAVIVVVVLVAKELLEILACPKCKGDIRLKEDESGFICDACKLMYPIKDDIPIMLIDEAIKLDEE